MPPRPEPLASAPTESPSPLRGGVRGGGNPDNSRSAIPPSLSLPHKGGGDAAPAAALAIWQDGAFHRDAWVRADDGEPLPDAPAIVTKKRWLAEAEALASRSAPLGLLIAAGESLDDVAADLPRFALIALDFPKFSDGRAFSTARLLREKHGYAGELRAVGNVLSDQIPFMRRVGFDSFEVTHEPTRRALIEGHIAEVTLYYQPTGTPEPPAGTRPWLRRASAEPRTVLAPPRST
jgi:uncharacterized protein (DUF934 family)